LGVPEKIAILCTPGDLHALAVLVALRLRGVEPLLWYPSDFPTRARETFSFSTGTAKFDLSDHERSLRHISARTVWNRRMGANTDFSGLLPADHQFSWAQRQAFRQGSLQAAFPTAFWVNPPATARLAENKLYQHSVATGLGFTLPDTVFTNDSSEIKSFLRAHGGKMIYKAFPAPLWRQGEDTLACYSVCLTEKDLVEDELLESTPGIYQEVVPKAFEVRLTMMGAQPFAAKILSQETTEGKVDWRRAYSELTMEPFQLPADLIATCRQLMGHLNLVFGCFDFIVRPDGAYVFLEVNQQGQFLFVEEYTGLPLLEGFCDFLLHGADDFVAKPKAKHLSYLDVAAETATLAKEATLYHVPQPTPAVSE
jgi:hypothetical protein